MVGRDDIIELVRMIWEAILGLQAEPCGEAGPEKSDLTGCIQITGGWQGAVTLACDRRLARRAAAVMFGVDDADLTRDLVFDALGELTNMIGGNAKALMPGRCFLSMPAVVEGEDYSLRVLAGRVTCVESFLAEGMAFRVSVYARADGAAERVAAGGSGRLLCAEGAD